ncbi:MAG TPA: mercury methylation ferredoxin HgcB [Candidatus Krumholzibacterium sp.]|nr:mercury methylation ferredoxin HgcB [Candidatus Krumholzibacterium sp.]
MGLRYLKNVSTLRLDASLCNGCGTCLKVCPHEVFGMADGKASILDADACMECGACMINCASEAIRVDAGVGCAAAVINGMIRGGEPDCDCGSGCCG